MYSFGTSGIRSLFCGDLLQLAFQVGFATGTLYSNVIVGRNTRTSGSVIRYAVISGLLANGSTCHDTEALPTLTLTYGSAFSAEQQKAIEDLLQNEKLMNAPRDVLHTVDSYGLTVEDYINRTMEDAFGEKC